MNLSRIPILALATVTLSGWVSTSALANPPQEDPNATQGLLINLSLPGSDAALNLSGALATNPSPTPAWAGELLTNLNSQSQGDRSPYPVTSTRALDLLASPQTPQTLAQSVPTDSSGAAGDTFSSEAQKIRTNLLIEPLFGSGQQTLRPVPGSTLGVPSAYGANWRDVFIGGGFVGSGQFSTPTRVFDLDPDGSISFGAGFGDAVKTIGFEVDIAIISLRSDFADSGSIGFKFHKVFPELGNLAVATGWSNPIDWGDSNDAPETVYGVVTKAFDLRPNYNNPLPLTVTGGIGTGGFRSKGAIDAKDNAPNFFGSVGLRIIPQLSVINTWTGNQLNMGISSAPFRQVPFTLNVGAGDVTNNRGNGVRFLMSGGFGYSF